MHYPNPAGQPLMMPLTESLYVPAKLADTEHVLVDVGTGYYVQVWAGNFQRRMLMLHGKTA